MPDFRSPFQIYAPVPAEFVAGHLYMVCPDCGQYIEHRDPVSPGGRFEMRHVDKESPCEAEASHTLVLRGGMNAPYLEVRRFFGGEQ